MRVEFPSKGSIRITIMGIIRVPRLFGCFLGGFRGFAGWPNIRIRPCT